MKFFIIFFILPIICFASCQTIDYQQYRINGSITGIWGHSEFGLPLFYLLETSITKIGTTVTFSYPSVRYNALCFSPSPIYGPIQFIPTLLLPNTHETTFFPVPTENNGLVTIGLMSIDPTGSIIWYTNGANNFVCGDSIGTSGLMATSVTWNTIS